MSKRFPFYRSSPTIADDDSVPSGKDSPIRTSKWTRARPYCFCCLRYGAACLVGALIAVGIVLIVLWQIGLFGGGGGSGPTIINLGELPYAPMTVGYTEVNLTLSPVASATSYRPKHFIIESQALNGAQSGRFLAEGFSDGAWKVASRANYDASRPVVGTIAGLTASSSLILRYRIEMTDGRVSSASVASVATLLPPTAPSAPSVEAYKTSTSSVSVLLVEPQSMHGSKVTQYQLRYAVAAQNPQWTAQTISAGDFTKPFTVQNLSSRQVVMFTAVAVNGIGSSPSSPIYNMSSDTNEAAPPGKVAGGKAVNITSSSVMLEWSVTTDNGAMILRYLISVKGKQTVEVDGHRTNVTITGLTRGTTYDFTIQAVNSHGKGTASDPIKVTTKNLCEADAPSQVRVQAVFADGISIRWYSPQNPTCDLQITNYRVVWSDSGNVACTPTSGLHFCDVTGLSNSKLYSVKVQAENAAGWSSKSSANLSATTLAKAPSGIGCNTRDQVRWWVSVQNNDGNSLYYNGQQFSKQMATCGEKSFGDAAKQAECLLEYTGDSSRTPFNLKAISNDCANLLGVLTHCGASNCMSQCIASESSEACIKCNDDHCIPAFYRDAGLTRSIAPENPSS